MSDAADDSDDSDDEPTVEDLRESITGGVSPKLLATAAPTLPIAVEALAHEYTRMAGVARTARESADDAERAAYQKGRQDAYAMVATELATALATHTDATLHELHGALVAPATAAPTDGDGE